MRSALLALAAIAALPSLAKAPAKKPAAAHHAAAAHSYAILPAQLQEKYLSMTFKTAAGEDVEIKLDALKYMNPHYPQSLQRIDLKNKMLPLVNAELKKDKEGVEALVAPYKIKNNDPAFIRVFTGEGTPEQVRAVLQLASRLQGKLGKFWKDKGDAAATMKEFYWSNIGLNCNGFVGSYAKAVGAKQTSDTPILAYAPPAKRIKDLADLQPGDVMVFKDGKHIVAIQGKRDDGGYDAVESAGTPELQGLGKSIYHFTPAGDGLWKAQSVSAKTGKKGGSTLVYLAPLK